DLAGEPTGSGITSSTNSDNIISGLDPDTDYNFYIRSICSGAPGDWSSPFPFRTLCTVKNMPYFTDFTTGSTEGSEPCWNVMDLNHDNVTWDFLGGWDGIVDAYASIVTNINQNNNNDYLISLQIYVPDDETTTFLTYK